MSDRTVSDNIYEQNGFIVTRYCGPAPEVSGIPDRARWQITIPGGEVTALLRDEVAALAAVLANSAADAPRENGATT